MGDRAVVMFTDGKEVSPTVYLHWNGTEVPEWLEELKALMADRTGDLGYAVARFIGVCHGHISGALSLGCWNTEEDVQLAVKTAMVEPVQHTDARSQAFDKLREYSHGDAGVVVVNVEDFSWLAVGGYLEKEALAA